MTTGLETLERSASMFYTTEIFYEVQNQIEGFAALLVLHRDSIGSTEKFIFRKYRKPHHVYSVFVDRSCDKWCKDAKVADSSSQHASVDPTDGFPIRYSALWSACLLLCLKVLQCRETYNTAMIEVARISREFESLGGIGQTGSRVQARANETHILDPKIIRSKGAPRGSTNADNGRHCRQCLGLDHDRRNCIATDDDVVDEDGGSSHRPIHYSGKRSRRN
ncbi:uncharacterized protein DS421_16g552470 [Arachis hypogaea]|nr:uncharacterized protein DS421_16g552470 [Arachis hypogaea]